LNAEAVFKKGLFLHNVEPLIYMEDIYSYEATVGNSRSQFKAMKRTVALRKKVYGKILLEKIKLTFSACT